MSAIIEAVEAARRFQDVRECGRGQGGGMRHTGGGWEGGGVAEGVPECGHCNMAQLQEAYLLYQFLVKEVLQIGTEVLGQQQKVFLHRDLSEW